MFEYYWWRKGNTFIQKWRYLYYLKIKINYYNSISYNFLADSVRSRCLESIYSQLSIEKSDSSALFGICLLYAISENKSLSTEYYEGFLTPVKNEECISFVHCDERNVLIDKLVNIITAVSEPGLLFNLSNKCVCINKWYINFIFFQCVMFVQLH